MGGREDEKLGWYGARLTHAECRTRVTRPPLPPPPPLPPGTNDDGVQSFAKKSQLHNVSVSRDSWENISFLSQKDD